MVSKEKKDSTVALLLKIFGIALLLIFGIILAVNGDNLNVKAVKVVFDNGSSINVLTTKETVSQILSESHIYLLEGEYTTPVLEETLDEKNEIIISKTKQEEAETIEAMAIIENDIINENDYLPLKEGIITVQEEIPFETIYKDVSNNKRTTTSKILQEGIPGILETTYKTKYKGEIELENERVFVSSTVIQEPVNKIVQISSAYVTSRSAEPRVSSNTLAQRTEGITPIVKTLNTSAYTASTCDKLPSDPTYGITSSGNVATSWYTVAAGRAYPIGTIIYIPYFKNAVNEGWFVVQDRGGAITNSKLDIYMDSYDECISFGRRNLECYIYVL